MISKKIEEAFNKQIMEEENASRIYLSMASWCDVNGYPGAAAFFHRQTQEERFHALKFLQYINERGGHAKLESLPQPTLEFKNIKEVFELSLEHEKYVTKCINNLYELAIEEKDYASQNWLNWFLEEQVEEETSMNDILDKIELVRMDEDGKRGFFMLDRELKELGDLPFDEE